MTLHERVKEKLAEGQTDLRDIAYLLHVSYDSVRCVLENTQLPAPPANVKRCLVVARAWDPEFVAAFGETFSVHELTDEQIVAAILKRGRAELEDLGAGLFKLCFQNDYD